MNPGGFLRDALVALGLWLSPAALRAGESWSLVLAQGGGVSLSKTGGKSFIVESVVTVALFGIALWVICKSSRRV